MTVSGKGDCVDERVWKIRGGDRRGRNGKADGRGKNKKLEKGKTYVSS
jgi:hypothetical protein